MPRIVALIAVLASVVAVADAAAAEGCWKLVGSDVFRGGDALMRSQGVTSDGAGWVFSWQGGLERTSDDYTPATLGTLPPDLAVAPTAGADGKNHVGDNHIGDIDVYDGLIYAPVED